MELIIILIAMGIGLEFIRHLSKVDLYQEDPYEEHPD